MSCGWVLVRNDHSFHNLGCMSLAPASTKMTAGMMDMIMKNTLNLARMSVPPS